VVIGNQVLVGDLSEGSMVEFEDARASDGFAKRPHRPGFAVLLQILREGGAVSAPAEVSLDGVESLLLSYRRWLLEDRGLAATTISRYQNTARRFLLLGATREGDPRVDRLTGVMVSDFLLADARRYDVGAMKGRVAELRALLRYFYVRGLTAHHLDGAVPPVAGWRETTIPRYLPQSDVESIIGSCNRSTTLGIRDVAIILLLARLGLRCIEIARLELDDIDWRRAEIRVRGKSRRIEAMPLPAEVGDAVATYLRGARPSTQDRHLFQTYRAPIRAVPPDLLSDVVRRACSRAGLPPAGAHRIRHALATGLLAQGVPLVDISAGLRHQDLATTAIYARVDLPSLRAVAQPWPGVSL
jgi:integrase/recombinase XerD